MEDVVLRELETLAKERKEAVTAIIANAVVRLAERQREAVLEDVEWGLHG